MRVYQPTYKDKATGKYKKQNKYWIEFRDHLGIKRRLPACGRRREAEAFGRHVENLIACRLAAEHLTAPLLHWLEGLPIKILGRLEQWGVIDPEKVSLAHPLTDHMTDFEQSLKAKGRTAKHIRETVSGIREICTACSFTSWRDITASKVDYYLGQKREDRVSMVDGQEKRIRGISARTYNHKLKAFKQFCLWMVKEGRAIESPVTHLAALNTETVRRRTRRALTVAEARKLLATAAQAKAICSMKGPERALLYRLAIETGLRAGELRSLTAESCNAKNRTILVRAVHSKHRQKDVVMLKKDTATLLEDHIRHKTPKTPLFTLPCKENMSLMLKADLKAARVPYQDERGHYADFHSFRHTTGTWLTQSGVHPKIAQDIMRHTDVNLTMNTYTHVLMEKKTQAIDALPDLSIHLPGGKMRKERA